MKIGVFDHLQKNDRPELSYQDLFARRLDMVEFIDQAGFDYYFVAEHHFDMGFAETGSAYENSTENGKLCVKAEA